MDIVIARKPALSAVEWVAISYPSKDRGRSGIKAPHGDAYSFDVDEVPSAIETVIKSAANTAIPGYFPHGCPPDYAANCSPLQGRYLRFQPRKWVWQALHPAENAITTVFWVK